MKIENLSKSSAQPTLNVKMRLILPGKSIINYYLTSMKILTKKKGNLLRKVMKLFMKIKEMKVQDFTKMTKDFQAMIRKNLPPYVEADKNFLLNKTN